MLSTSQSVGVFNLDRRQRPQIATLMHRTSTQPRTHSHLLLIVSKNVPTPPSSRVRLALAVLASFSLLLISPLQVAKKLHHCIECIRLHKPGFCGALTFALSIHLPNAPSMHEPGERLILGYSVKFQWVGHNNRFPLLTFKG